jgi:hypothetical protein
MESGYSYREALHEINIAGLYHWQNTIYNHRILAKIFAIALIVWTIAVLGTLVQNYVDPILGFFGLLSGGFLILSIILYENKSSFIFLFLGVTFLGLSINIFGIIVVVMYSYLVYQLMKVRQMNKAEKFARMTPIEIAKIKRKKEPKVELTVRGDR